MSFCKGIFRGNGNNRRNPSIPKRHRIIGIKAKRHLYVHTEETGYHGGMAIIMVIEVKTFITTFRLFDIIEAKVSIVRSE